MNMRHVYVALCLLGVVLPFGPLASLMASNGFDFAAYPAGLFGTPVAAALTLDLAVATAAFLCFVYTDGPERGMRRLWIYAVVALFVNVAVALPLYLHNREIRGSTSGF